MSESDAMAGFVRERNEARAALERSVAREAILREALIAHLGSIDAHDDERIRAALAQPSSANLIKRPCGCVVLSECDAHREKP